MDLADTDYYLSRAEEELTLGETASNKRAAWAHFQLAGRYLDLAYGGPANEDAKDDMPLTLPAA